MIATNVVHETRNIRRTLRNTKATLKKHGVILINEISKQSLLSHLTFGLLEGWWLYDDVTLRIPGCPALDPETWADVLREEGFGTVLFPVKDKHELGEQVIIAESDGIVRQEQPVKTSSGLPATGNRERPSSQAATKEVSSRGSLSLKEIQRTLKRTIRELLLLREEHELDEETTFMDLGLDSITVVSFIKELSDQFELSFRETIVFDYPTIGALAGYIAKKIVSDASFPGPPIEVSQPEVVKTVSNGALSEFKHHLGAVMEKYQELIPLQIEGDGPLLSCIHPMSGDVGGYTKLADAAGTRFRLIGIRSTGFLTAKTPLTTIEAMGEYYAEMMAAVDEKGPFHLYGTSMGGTVAYETARHLQLRNKIVKTLFLVEPPLVEDDIDASLWDSDEVHNWVMNANFLLITMLHLDPKFRQRKSEGKVNWSELGISIEDVANLSVQEIPERLVTLITQRGVNQTREILRQRLNSMAAIHLANLRGVNRYRAPLLSQPDNVNVILLRTRSADATSERVYNPDYLVNIQKAKGGFAHFLKGWQRVLPKLQIKEIDGEHHFDLLSSQNAIQQMVDLIISRMLNPLQQASNSVISKTPKLTPFKRARVEIESIPRPNPQIAENKIAVIGMSGQFPGATTLDDFWRLLKNGASAITEFPKDRDWNFGKLNGDTQSADGNAVRYGGFLENIDCFDPLFFQIPPKEAEMMDPSERFFLQESWKAIEDAGIDPTTLSNQRWGVFCGGGSDYTLRLKEIMGTSPHVTGSGVPGRVSYNLNLKGPCLAVDVGCASSLMAVAQACDNLVLDTCDVAIAGGVLIYSTPNLIDVSNELQLLSGDDRPLAFDAEAQGMLPGEAVGVLILKSLDKAVTDGDRIHGVIEAWRSNNSGKTNGVSAPSVVAEEALFSDVYDRFQINPETISFVEANATGTPLGDAMEVQALTDAFRKKTAKRQYCALGSVENNIGHAWQGSGMSHLIKVLLALKHGEIPGTLNVASPNPALDLGNSPFFINPETIPWTVGENRLHRAAVSSFGGVGTNVHLVVTDPPAVSVPRANHSPQSNTPVLITLSATTTATLRQRCRDLNEFLKTKQREEGLNLVQLSANLLMRRSQFSERCALVVDSLEALQSQLSSLADGGEPEGGAIGSVTKKVRSSLLALSRLAVRSLIDQEGSRRENLLALADLYIQGVPLDLSETFSKSEKFPLSLPGYPFEKRRCWVTKTNSVKRLQEELITPAISSEKPHSIPKRRSVLAVIQEQVTEITGYQSNEIEVDGPLNRYGLDSLMSMRLLAIVNERFSLDLQLADLAEHNSINDLASLVEKEITEVNAYVGYESTDFSVETFPPQSQWFAVRLSQFLKKLNVVSLNSESHANRKSSLEPCRRVLSQLLPHGIAVFHDGRRCHFLSHRSINIEGILNTLSSAQQQERLAHIPVGTLIAPISQEQKRNLYHSEVMKSSALNVQHVYESTMDSLDLLLLNKAMALVSQNQDLLRTHYFELENGWGQIVISDANPEFRQIDVASLPDFQKHIATERSRLLKVDELPLFQAWISRIDGTWYLGFVTHHSLADAFTTTMLFSEVMGYYQDLLKQQAPLLRPVSEQYWQYALLQYGDGVYRGGKNNQYWQEQLSGAAHSIQLPYARDPLQGDPKLLQVAGGHMISLSTPLSDEIGRFNQDYEITYTQLFTTAISMSLIHGLGNDRAMIQLMHNQRDRASLMNTLGEFTNILFMSLEIDPDFLVIDVLNNVKSKSLDNLRYGKIDFLELLKLTGLDSHENYYRQLGDVLIDSADIDAGTLDSSAEFGRSMFTDALVQAQQKNIDFEGQTVATLAFQILKINQQIHLLTGYRKHLFYAPEMEQMSALIVQVVEEMVHTPQQQVKDILSRLDEKFNKLRVQAERFQWSPSEKLSQVIAPASKRQVSGGEEEVRELSKSARKKKPVSFPECQRVNRVKQGRPIFWVHGAFGDASVYIPLAEKIGRPFYGIQARGLYDDKSPLTGIKTIASFYRSMIQSIQPEGPYDLGGYSVGGTLIYEVAYQLQTDGEIVRSLTLADPLYPPVHEKLGGKSLYDGYYFLAIGLIDMTFRNDPEISVEIMNTLKKPEYVEDKGILLNSFVDFCIDAGIKRPKKWIRDYIQKMLEIQWSYEVVDYVPSALLQEIPYVRYFKNRDGLFYGKNGGHFNLQNDDPLMGVDYWSEWKNLIPNIAYRELVVDNHLVFFEDKVALKEMRDYCSEIYDRQAESLPSPNGAVNQEPSAVSDLNRDLIHDKLIGFLVEMTDVSERDIDLAGHLRDYGIDSLLAMRFLNRINAEFCTDLDVSLIMKETVREIADEIENELKPIQRERGTGSAKGGTRHFLSKDNSWVRPLFIDSIELELKPNSRSISAKERNNAEKTLGLIVSQGIGIWKDGDRLCFEFFKGAHTKQSLSKLIPSPELLFRILEPGKTVFPNQFLTKSFVTRNRSK